MFASCGHLSRYCPAQHGFLQLWAAKSGTGAKAEKVLFEPLLGHTSAGFPKIYKCEKCVHRDVVAPSLQAVGDAADALRSKGFVNYFGLQRFGAGVNATHQ